MKLVEFRGKEIQADVPKIQLARLDGLPLPRIGVPLHIGVRWEGELAIMSGEMLAQHQMLHTGNKLWLGPFQAEIIDYDPPPRNVYLIRKIPPKVDESQPRKASQC